MWLKRAEKLLNRCIDESTRARAARDELQGRSLGLVLAGLSTGFTLTVGQSGVRVTAGLAEPLDVRIEARLIEVFGLLEADSVESLRRSNAKVHGDLRAAEAFGELLRHARPDLEEELARYVGDVPAHAVATLTRGLSHWLGDARTASELNLADYLKSEARLVPDPIELSGFTRAVERTRDDVARLEQRLDRVSRSLTPE